MLSSFTSLPKTHETELLKALNAAFVSLLGRAHSPEAVYKVFNDQISKSGFHGSISLLDETGEYLIIRATAFPEGLQKMVHLIEKFMGIKAHEYRYPLLSAKTDHQVMISRTPVFLLDNSEKINQVLRDDYRAFRPFILKVFARIPAILAPIIQAGSCIGVLYVAGQRLQPGDISAVAAFANQVAIALENARLLETTHQAEAQYRRLFETASDGILILDPRSLKLLSTNPKAIQMTGYSHTELLQMTFADLLPPGTLEGIPDFYEVFRQKGKILFEFTLRQQSGLELMIQMAANLFEMGGKLFLQGFMRDITEKKLSEEALRRSEDKFRTLAAAAPGVIYLCKNDYHFSMFFINDAIETLTGYPKEEFLAGRISFRDIYHPDDSSRILPENDRELEQNKVFQDSYRIRHRSGEWRWVEDRGSGVFDEDGSLLFLAGFITDISERKQAEILQAALYQIAAVASSDITLDTLYHAIHQIVGGLIDARNFYIALYDKLNNLITFPYFVDEVETKPEPYQFGNGLTEYVILTGKSMLVRQHEHKQMVAEGIIERVGPTPFVWLGVPLQSKAHTIGVIVVQSYQDENQFMERERELLGFVSGQIAAAIERKQTEEFINAYNARLQSIMESTQDMVFALDRGFRYLAFNQNHKHEMKKIYGVDIEVGCNILDFMRVHGDDEKAYQNISRVLSGEQYVHEGVYESKQHERRYYEASYSPIRNERGEVTGAAVFVRDATERKQTEETLRRTQKIESLGVMAGGIAHDFNNLLVAMMGQTSLALAKLTPQHPAYVNVEKAVKAAEKASDLTRQLLAYTGRGQAVMVTLNLNKLILENHHLLEVTIPKHIKLHMNLTEELPLIKADSAQIQQIVMNLILNAAEAIGDKKGCVTVTTSVRRVQADDSHYWQRTNQVLTPDNYVCLEVSDTGSGMDEETLAKIFDPFFTTKFTGRGLGLAMVLGIVRGHQGGLYVQSELGAGTHFELLFPVSKSALSVVLSTNGETTVKTQSGLVLVIDDEEPVREAVTDILEMEGIRVITAANGRDGIELYQERQSEINLVILDLSMPGMSGAEAFQVLRSINPDVRVILSSGYNEGEVNQRLHGQGGVSFIQKPYSLNTLAKTVRHHLE